MKHGRRWYWLAVLVAVIGTVSWLLADTQSLRRTLTLLSAIKINQMLELMRGVGEVGVLADGSGAATLRIAPGIEVPVALGHQPLVARPLPPLPMEDHPYMLDEYASAGVHADSYNSSVSPLPGPLGIDPVAHVVQVMDDEIGMCTPLMRDLQHRLASVCISLGGPSKLVLFDPQQDFAVLASTPIPKRRSLLDPAGGWYSRMDHLGRPIVPTPAQDIRVYEVLEERGVYRWNIAERWDLSQVLPEDVSPNDAIPDWRGNFWFISGFGHLGYLNRRTGLAQVMVLGDGTETIGAALAVSRAGAYVLSSAALYMLGVRDGGEPFVRWRWPYGSASGADLSTPTLLDAGRLITFSINGIGDRSQLVVINAAVQPLADADRVVCRIPLFKPGKSAIKNTVIGYHRSIVAQNNYGADFYELMEFEPGLARVDVRADGSGCDLRWENDSVSGHVPPRLSTGDGHVYLYSRRRGTPDDVHAWYLTAVDFDTGEPVSELFIASGRGVDNPMLSVDFWPDGVLVAGIRNGIVTLRDSGSESGEQR